MADPAKHGASFPGGADVPPPPAAKGAVTDEAGAGKAEATLLMVGALRAAAGTLARRIATAAPQAAGVIIAAGETPPDFSALDRFELGLKQLGKLLDEALAAAPGASVAGERDVMADAVGLVPGVNAAGAVLGAVATAAQFFAVQTRFTGLQLAANDSLLVRELAAVLLQASPRPVVELAPGCLAPGGADVYAAMQTLADLGAKVAARAQAMADQPAGAVLAAAGKAQQDFTALVMNRQGGAPAPIDEIAGLYALRARLEAGAVLVTVRVAAAGGGLLARTGLFLGLFRDPPNRVFGAAIAGFSILRGADLQLIDAGNIRAPSRYIEMRDIAFLTDDTGTVTPGR